MGEFWQAAAKVVKPGGTVALWTNSSLYCRMSSEETKHLLTLTDPSTRNASEVQRSLSDLEDGFLGPFESQPVNLSRNMYNQLAMPWNLDPAVSEFSETTHLRYGWTQAGKFEAGADDFFSGSHEQTLKELGESLGTASMVTKWRNANPKLAGTDQDCVNITIHRMAKAMGADGRDDLTIKTGSATALLLFTRS
jgi:hypothetical protein